MKILKTFFPVLFVVISIGAVYTVHLDTDIVAVHPRISASEADLKPVTSFCQGFTAQCELSDSGWQLKSAFNGIKSSLPFQSGKEKYFGKRMFFIYKQKSDVQYIFEEFIWNQSEVSDLSELIKLDKDKKIIYLGNKAGKFFQVEFN